MTALQPDAFVPELEPGTLVAYGLRKTYRRRRVVDEVSLRVRPGEIVGLLGPNGAGKTTTFYMIAGVTRPERGRIYLGHEDITDLPIHRRARQGLGYLPQERSLFRRMTVENNLKAVLELTGLPADQQRERLEQGLVELGLTQIRNSRGYQLSGGESRRVEIARALVMSPSVILLDEPFAGVDPIAVLDIQEVIQQIRSKSIGILITDHNVRETLGITDRAYIVSEGRILVEGHPDELVHNEIARRIYLGEQFTL
jgi:lipopolysaccharide export system ATP-binding protein